MAIFASSTFTDVFLHDRGLPDEQPHPLVRCAGAGGIRWVKPFGTGIRCAHDALWPLAPGHCDEPVPASASPCEKEQTHTEPRRSQRKKTRERLPFRLVTKLCFATPPRLVTKLCLVMPLAAKLYFASRPTRTLQSGAFLHAVREVQLPAQARYEAQLRNESNWFSVISV